MNIRIDLSQLLSEHPNQWFQDYHSTNIKLAQEIWDELVGLDSIAFRNLIVSQEMTRKFVYFLFSAARIIRDDYNGNTQNIELKERKEIRAALNAKLVSLKSNIQIKRFQKKYKGKSSLMEAGIRDFYVTTCDPTLVPLDR